MKRVLKVTGAVCLGIVIWILVWICIIFVLNTKMKSITEGLGSTAKEAKADTSGSQVESHDGESAELTINITGNSLTMPKNERADVYYDNMQEAINASYISAENNYERDLSNIIKQFEINNYVVVCYNAIKNDQEESFIMAYFKVKNAGGDKKYNYICSEVQDKKYSKNKKIELIELIHNQIEGSMFRMVNSINDENKFICGVIDEKYFDKKQNVDDLKIEGQKPDEIIEYESFGGVSYFWYYSNFQSDKSTDELKVTLEE